MLSKFLDDYVMIIVFHFVNYALHSCISPHVGELDIIVDAKYFDICRALEC